MSEEGDARAEDVPGGHRKGKAGLEIFDCRASQGTVYMGKRPNVSDFDDFDPNQDHRGRKFMRYTRAQGVCGAVLGLSTGRRGWPGTARTATMSALKVSLGRHGHIMYPVIIR